MDNPDSVAFDAELDTTGLYCPEPIMLMHNRVRDMHAGEVLKVVASDPGDYPRRAQVLQFSGP